MRFRDSGFRAARTVILRFAHALGSSFEDVSSARAPCPHPKTKPEIREPVNLIYIGVAFSLRFPYVLHGLGVTVCCRLHELKKELLQVSG